VTPARLDIEADAGQTLMESSYSFASHVLRDLQKRSLPSMQQHRKATTMTTEEDKDALIASLRAEAASLKESVSYLQGALIRHQDLNTTYYASKHSQLTKGSIRDIPEYGAPARFVKERIEQLHLCDFRPRLNTSSYVNVVWEPEERAVAMLGAEVNLADASVYPASVKLHDHVVDLLARLWNAPDPPIKDGHYCGAGTVGSTEACLLAGLALKFRWRKWYAARHGLDEAQVVGVKPNIVISTAYQVRSHASVHISVLLCP
jgi:hypothetical protein